MIMDSKKLFSKVFQGKWQVEKVISESTGATGNAGSITTLELVVHDMENPAIKYNARLAGSNDDPLEKRQFILDVPYNG
jgi:hypothetical protein